MRILRTQRRLWRESWILVMSSSTWSRSIYSSLSWFCAFLCLRREYSFKVPHGPLKLADWSLLKLTTYFSRIIWLPDGKVHQLNIQFTEWFSLCLQVEHPQRSKKAVWHKLLSKQRKRAVVACFRMAPLYNLPRYVLKHTHTPHTHVKWRRNI